MPSTKEIKGRIKSVCDTQKITNAMYLIASTKLRKAKEELENTRPYFDRLVAEMRRIFILDKKADSSYFYPKEKAECDKIDARPSGVVVITADKGLAGAYNMNVIKEAERLIGRLGEYKLYVVGEYGRQYFRSHKIPIEKSFLYTAQNPTLRRAREICELLLSEYDQNTLGTIYIVYTDMINSMVSEVASERILPLSRKAFSDNKDVMEVGDSFEFTPNPSMVIDNCIRSHLTGYIYGALIDSFCSEQNARMNAMSAANDNAQEILDELSVQYNRVRQAAITREITEVCAGAKAQKKKRAKEAAKVC